ncbi:hypothetical protein LCI18_014702 [Fusarium solani-melongenae]|uniref:Uncharacterized protein n=1 Tax=Fusarium solani subsp. cucurbitae TaxID=2747967 RepID=A0ACD3ZS39_FUSSC|nr:hypothetical protein LCI18_014702 [Fusarium solani-melongenae]
MLEDEIEDILQGVGRYGWEDSVEIKSQASWSPGLPLLSKLSTATVSGRISRCLCGRTTTSASRKEIPAAGQGYINDFRATLQLGYRDYISTLSHWLRERLGLGLRTQVSYNLPMEMGVKIPFVDVPECESLGFGDGIDGYHQFMGPAALAGKRVVSNEMGAIFLAAYKHDIPRLVHQSDLAFAAGNNRLVLHGLAFGGNYSATTWPGHSAFNYFVAEMHSQKHPSWQAGMPEAMEYLARTQFVMHEGLSRADVAIYHHVSGTDPAMPRLYKATDLETAGFSYLYIALDNLRYDTARVKNGILGPDTASFRALILMPGAAMSPQSAKDLIELAEDGLPILIAEDPVAYLSSDGSDKSDVLDAIKMLKALPSVHTIANGTAAAILRSLDINPFVGTQVNNGTWIKNRRHDARRAIDYVFFSGCATSD